VWVFCGVDISPKGALLQTFPKDYDFGEEIKTVEVSRHIGNAVPPKLGETIGNCITKLGGNSGRDFIPTHATINSCITLTTFLFIAIWQQGFIPIFPCPARKLGDISTPQKTHTKDNHISINEIIKSLPALKSGETCKKDKVHKTRNLLVHLFYLFNKIKKYLGFSYSPYILHRNNVGFYGFNPS
jgi:hypothetical protein